MTIEFYKTLFLYYMKNYGSDHFGRQLGEAVKRLREQKNMTQEELRESAGFATGYISRLEAGEYASPSISQIFQLAQGLGMTLRDLLEYASLIPETSTFEGCLRGEGLNEEQVKKVTEYKNYIVYSTKDDDKKA